MGQRLTAQRDEPLRKKYWGESFGLKGKLWIVRTFEKNRSGVTGVEKKAQVFRGGPMLKGVASFCSEEGKKGDFVGDGDCMSRGGRSCT